MIGTSKPSLRLRGSGAHLRLRVATAPDPLIIVNECCRASVAVEKALGEAIRAAIAAGHSWTEIGQSLGLEARTSEGVREEFEASRVGCGRGSGASVGRRRNEARCGAAARSLSAVRRDRQVC
jgi:hypothetical protein